MPSINNYIKKYRQIISNKKLLKNICVLLSAVLSFFLIASLIEEIFYLSSFDRRNYMILLLSISVASILYIIITWIINYFGLLQNNSDESLAYKIGYKVPQIKDRLLNAIQLNKINSELDLTKLAVKNIKHELGNISINKIVNLFPK